MRTALGDALAELDDAAVVRLVEHAMLTRVAPGADGRKNVCWYGMGEHKLEKEVEACAKKLKADNERLLAEIKDPATRRNALQQWRERGLLLDNAELGLEAGQVGDEPGLQRHLGAGRPRCFQRRPQISNWK